MAVLVAVGLLAIACATVLWTGSPDRAVVVGPLWTPQLTAIGAVLGPVLLVIAAVRASARARSGPPRAWPTLLADGGTALAVIGLVSWTALVIAGLAVWTSGDRLRPVPGTDDRFVEEQDAFFSCHGWERDGIRDGLVIRWDRWERSSCV